LVQMRPSKGDVAGNLARIRAAVERGAAEGAQLLVFPECALSGYAVEGAADQVSRSPGEVREFLGVPPEGAPDLVLGMYEPGREGIHNSAVYLTPGTKRWEVVHVHRKVFLPSYGVFEEARFVVPGSELQSFPTRFGRVGLLVCEDMHHSLCPTLLALDGADLLLCVAASPVRDLAPGPGIPGSLERWDAVGRSIALEHGVHLLVTQLAGSEGGKLFGGGSVAYGPGGRILARGALFREDEVDLVLDPAQVRKSRVSSSMLSDLRVMLPHLLPQLDRAGKHRHGVGPRIGTGGPEPEPSKSGTADSTPELRAPVDPEDASMFDLDLELVERALVQFLIDEVKDRRGFHDVVVGVSGGVDSAVSLELAVRAFGPDRVHAFLLPYATSSPESLELGRKVVERVGVEHRVISVAAGVDAYVEEAEPEISPLRRGNLAARYRAMVLWDQSARIGGIPLGTGNKSERLLGYFTWHADDAPPVNPLGDLYKTQVLSLARHLGVPDEVVERPPSPDLVPGVHDADELGIEYAVADRILYRLLEGRTPAELVEAGFSPEHVELVHGRLEGTHWKRRLPTVAMLSSTAIGEYYLRPVDL
jgi:NAD+ synthase (glutamine-hydrolysing)